MVGTVVHGYYNYSGDIMNFEMVKDMAEMGMD